MKLIPFVKRSLSSAGTPKDYGLNPAMLKMLRPRPRRSIHSEKDKSNKQVHQECCKCGEPKSIEDSQSHKQSDDNHELLSENNPDTKIVESSFICKDCDKSEERGSSSQEFKQERLTRHGKFGKIGIVVILLIISVCCYYFLSNKERTFDVRIHNQTKEEINFDDELYGLEDVYKKQEERVWYTFAAGIKSVIAENPNKPSVFLLLYDNDLAENTIKCLIQDVTKVASKYLMKREKKPLIYAGKELNRGELLDDPGLLLVEIKEPVESSGAMIITSLQDVHPKVAASFHFFCDRYSPLVEKAVFFFTLKVKSISSTSLKGVAEEALQNLWANDLPENKLNPLITRMTGNVLKIVSDYSGCI